MNEELNPKESQQTEPQSAVPKGKVGMKGAALIQFGSRYASMGIQILLQMILARLISPEDFGLWTIINVFAAFFQLFSDMGIGAAIVQFRDLTEKEFGSLFGFTILLGVIMSAIFCGCAYPISMFYHDGRLAGACCFVAVSLFFNVLNMVPNGIMLRELRFRSIGIRTIVSALLSATVAIVFARFGFGYNALIFQVVAQSVVLFLWNIASRPIRHINFHFMKTLRRIFSYSIYQFGANMVNYFSRNLDNLLIPKVLGTAELGYYDKSYKLTTYPLSAFSTVIASVIQPYMAKHQDEPEVIFKYWLKIEKFLSLIAAVLVTVCLTCSNEIIVICYGSRWVPAVPAFSVLAISVYSQMMSNPSGAFFQSIGRTDLMFRTMIVNTLMSVTGLAVGLKIGTLYSVSVGIAVAFTAHLLTVLYYLVKRGFGQSFAQLKIFVPEILLAAAASAVSLFVARFLPENLRLGFGVKLAIDLSILVAGYAVLGQFKYLKLIKRRK